MIVAPFLLALATLASEPSSLAVSAAAKPTDSTRRSESEWTPETVDPAWADKALADPEDDRGWMQPCHDDWNDGRASACAVNELPFATRKGPIAIDPGENGGMTVVGWDHTETRVFYRVRARARTREEARDLASKVRLEVVNGWIKARGPASRGNARWSVEIKAWVPRRSDLALETKNGPIGVRGVRGTMDLHSVNGPLALMDVGGAVSARAQNGPLSVDLTGTKWSGAGLDAEAQNGPVALRIPRGYAAKLRAGTINGPLDIDYPLGIQGRIRGHFTATLGAGGPMVRVVTENGPFTLSER